MLQAVRFLMGLTQASLTVYCPVWVDAFARRDKMTQWMSWLQVTISFGIMFGYLLGWAAAGLKVSSCPRRLTISRNAGLFVNGVAHPQPAFLMVSCWPHALQTAAGDDECFGNLFACWRVPFLAQALLTVPLVFMFARIPARDLDVNRRHRRRRTSREGLNGESGPERGGRSILRQDSTTSSIASSESMDSSLWTGSSAASPSDTVLSGMRTATGDRSGVETSGESGSEGPVSDTGGAKTPSGAGGVDLAAGDDASLTCTEETRAICMETKMVCGKFYFTLPVATLCAEYYVMMTIQYWATDYLIRGPGGFNEHAVMACFITTNATAPVFGVIFGGWIIDKCGGYRGRSAQRSKAVGLIFLFQVGASCFAIPATYWPEGGIAFIVFCLWMILFFGGAAVPGLTGIFLDALPRKSKTMGSSISAVAFNLFAYFGSPIISSFIMSSYQVQYSDTDCEGFAYGQCPTALEAGFRLSLMAVVIALIVTMTMWIGGCWMSNIKLGVGMMSKSMQQLELEQSTAKGRGGRVSGAGTGTVGSGKPHNGGMPMSPELTLGTDTIPEEEAVQGRDLSASSPSLAVVEIGDSTSNGSQEEESSLLAASTVNSSGSSPLPKV